MMPYATALLLSAIGIALFIGAGSIAHRRGRRRRFERAAAWVFIALLTFKYITYWMPATDLPFYLPLNLCNLSELLACLSLLTRWYWFRSLLYFWALAAVVVFITPEPPDEPGTAAYALFWFSHALILGVTGYEVIVTGFRPRLRDLRMAVLVTLGYLAVVLPIDIIYNANYGYVGPVEPTTPTLIDYLGPWPLRVVWIVLLAAAAFILAWLPWWLYERTRR